MISGAITIGIGGLKDVVDTIAIGISTGSAVNINRIIDTVVISINAGQGRTGRVFVGVEDAIIVAVEIEIVGCAIAISVASTFDNIGDAVGVRINVEVIRRAITIGISGFELIVNAVAVTVSTAGCIDINRVINAIVVDVIPGQGWARCILNSVGDAIAVAIEIKIIRDAITVTVSSAFNNVSDAVSIGVHVEVVRRTIAIGIGGFKRIIDSVAVGISAACDINIKGIVDTIVVSIIAAEQRT